MKYKLSVLLLVLASQAAYADVEWIPGHGNAERTGYYAMQTNPANYHLLWKGDLGLHNTALTQNHIYSAMVIADDKIVYSLSEENAVNVPSAFIAALDLNNGKLLWRSKHDCRFMDISYSQGKILFTAQYCSYRRGAYDITNGKSFYSIVIPSPIGNIIPFENAAYYDAPNTPSYVAYDPINNNTLWENKDDTNRNSTAEIAVDNNYVVAQPFEDNKITVMSRLTGELQYEMNFSGYSADYSVPTLDSKTETLYITTLASSGENNYGAALKAIDLNQHAERWNVYSQSAYISPVVTDNMVYSMDNTYAKVEAINSVTGKIEWTWSPPADDAVLEKWVDMAATSDVLFVTGKKRLYAVSLATHETVWQLNQPVYNIALAKNKLVVETEGDATSYDHRLVQVFALN